MTEKTILSVGAGKDKFKYLDLDTKLLEVEFGAAMNEPVTYAVRKTIEGAVVELVNAGQKKGLWKFKAPEWKDPGTMPKVEVNIPTDAELLEVTTPDLEKVESIPPVEEQEIPEEVFTQKLLDELECGVNPHKLMCLEKSNETSNTSSDTPHTDR